MLYKYEVTNLNGERQTGSIDAPNLEIAISSLQRRNLIIISINPAEKTQFFSKSIEFFEKVRTKDIVLLSRQLSTLFEAKVPVLDSFKLLASEAESPILRRKLTQIVEDIQGGISMPQAMAKHPDVFSKFYISMVKSGEESGMLQEIFLDLSNHLERSYELTSKARNALIYPAFVVIVFIVVIILMTVFVIPKLNAIITEAGQKVPVFTQIIIGLSNFIINFGPVLMIGLLIGAFFLWRYTKTKNGKIALSRFLLSVPYVGGLSKKLYLARISDNLKILLSSGISMIRSLEITQEVVGNEIYSKILQDVTDAVKGGSSLSEALSKYEDVPLLVSRMIKIGEESGKLNFMLETLAKFYKREVDSAVENIVSLIEPLMIIVLGVMVGLLLISILGPIYNLSSAI
ncbi:type II secretion system F family protein [Patescibacteria group bacterium]|nr:type II secretion system F family protein [Patescibacteria group bacterium]